MSQDSEREVALITGASSGLGTEFARLLAERSYDLVITARREDRLKTLQKELESAHRCKVEIILEDLGAPTGADALITKVEALGRPIALLVNNAGYGVHGALVENDSARLQQMLQLNMMALTRLTHHFARDMVARRRGRILQVSSVGAFQPTPFYAAYSATKAYVLFLAEALQSELRGTGVTCTTLCPGLTATEFHEAAQHPKTGLVAMTMMSARSVALIGIKAMLRGRAVVTPGFINKLSELMVKLLPRSWATFGAGLLMRK